MVTTALTQEAAVAPPVQEFPRRLFSLAQVHSMKRKLLIAGIIAVEPTTGEESVVYLFILDICLANFSHFCGLGATL